MRRFDSKPIAALTVTGLAVVLGLASCGDSRAVVVREGPTTETFAPADASADATIEEVEIPMCPVTTCTARWATCPSSRFPCDTDLSSDDENCGGCGIRCAGEDPFNRGKWSCVEGQCTFSCAIAVGRHQYQSCDGDPTNGCESDGFVDNDNCGSCGNQCADDLVCWNRECVDRCVTFNLPDRCGPSLCTDLKIDDKNCGTCGTVCDPADPTLPTPPSDMYYGCGSATCGVPKCRAQNKANCNSDLSDGCEATLNTNEHCTACNDQCAPGKVCGRRLDGTWGCLCADGETLCDGTCVTLDDDPSNCGGCKNGCPGLDTPHFSPVCSFGACSGKCEDGFADCDRDFSNGCEVNTRVDNRNCGGCGNACLPGQVCFQGACQVAPCDAGMGGPTK